MSAVEKLEERTAVINRGELVLERFAVSVSNGRQSVLAQLTEASKVFESRSGRVDALHPISISISRGEVVVLQGHSGSGKTTLLHLLGLLLTPSTGTVQVCGLDSAQSSKKARDAIRRSDLGFVFQQAHLLPHLTVEGNVGLARPGVHPHAVGKILAELGLQNLSGRRPSELSGGEQQRVAVGRALVTSPQLVLADEPTANLDDENATAVIDALYSVAAYGGTIVAATHDVRLLERATRTIQLEKGSVIPDTRNCLTLSK